MDLQAWGKKESQAFTVPENAVGASEGPVGEATFSPIPVQPYFSLIAESYPQVPLALNSMTMTLGHLWSCCASSLTPGSSALGPAPLSSTENTILLDCRGQSCCLKPLAPGLRLLARRAPFFLISWIREMACFGQSRSLRNVNDFPPNSRRGAWLPILV